MAIDGQVVNKGEPIVDGPADPTIFFACWCGSAHQSTSSTKVRRSIDCRA